jgi:hypothetical protein
MNQITSVISTAQIKSGHLLNPFGWAADRLAGIIAANPKLLVDLLRIDCARMHLIALTFAHLNREATSDLGEVLIRGSVRVVTEKALKFYPRGIKRVLRHLPSMVLDPESYRHLIELLADNNALNILHHTDYFDERVIRTLHELPSALRNARMLQVLNFRDNNFSEGLRFLVSRGAASHFDSLVSELASVSKVEQIYSKIRGLVEALPLPTAFPPSQVAKARRIDQSVAVRSLANAWGNCLKDYLHKIHSGTCAVYVWEDSNSTAACLVKRHGRLGWFLNDVSGPQNASVDPQQVEQIRSAFSEVDIPPFETIAAISSMIHETEPKERRGNGGWMDLMGV